MGRWMNRLKSVEKNVEPPFDGTDKTDKTPIGEVSSVLSVRHGGEIEKNGSAAFDQSAEFEERAAILEYDEGLSRQEAEAQSAEELGLDGAGPRLALADDWRTHVHVAGPGVRITAPAIEVSPGEYDAHLDLLIAVAGAGTIEASVLSQKKRKGNVVSCGAGLIFTRGR